MESEPLCNNITTSFSSSSVSHQSPSIPILPIVRKYYSINIPTKQKMHILARNLMWVIVNIVFRFSFQYSLPQKTTVMRCLIDLKYIQTCIMHVLGRFGLLFQDVFSSFYDCHSLVVTFCQGQIIVVNFFLILKKSVAVNGKISLSQDSSSRFASVCSNLIIKINELTR